MAEKYRTLSKEEFPETGQLCVVERQSATNECQEFYGRFGWTGGAPCWFGTSLFSDQAAHPTDRWKPIQIPLAKTPEAPPEKNGCYQCDQDIRMWAFENVAELGGSVEIRLNNAQALLEWIKGADRRPKDCR